MDMHTCGHTRLWTHIWTRSHGHTHIWTRSNCVDFTGTARIRTISQRPSAVACFSRRPVSTRLIWAHPVSDRLSPSPSTLLRWRVKEVNWRLWRKRRQTGGKGGKLEAKEVN